MSGNYAGDPAASAKDAVRFRLGDTGPTFEFSNAEITYMLGLNGQRVLRTAAACARQLSAKYTGQVSKSVGSLSISYGERAASYATLADQLDALDRRTPGPIKVFGISESEKETDLTDTDKFGATRGIQIDEHRNPRVSDATNYSAP